MHSKSKIYNRSQHPLSFSVSSTGVASSGASFQGNDGLNSPLLMFDVAVAIYVGPPAHTQLGRRAGYAQQEAVRAKKTKYGGKHCPARKPIPLAFSACGDYSGSEGPRRRRGPGQIQGRDGRGIPVVQRRTETSRPSAGTRQRRRRHLSLTTRKSSHIAPSAM